MEMLAKYIRMRTARSAATASHPCVEHATEGINQYWEQSQKYKILSIQLFVISYATFIHPISNLPVYNIDRKQVYTSTPEKQNAPWKRYA
ncbi:MAG: hypothetical protein E7057_09775 [Lentisphaerae bacterium]|nr:hypothetical protein [Lentisphaerota bacterium]